MMQVMNDVIFPTRLHFGVHAIGETIERKVKIVCKVRLCSAPRNFQPPLQWSPPSWCGVFTGSHWPIAEERLQGARDYTGKGR